ncbi:hypothetical protein AB1H94_17025 [Pseudomonas fulva]|uniref:hypothetical protein n=1 Tax=Pseudomonas fulva TaxID=47880 RepID=UPI00345D8104
MQDHIDNLFASISCKSKDQILNEIKYQRSKGRFGIALEIIRNNRVKISDSKELAIIEHSLIKELSDSQSQIDFWKENRENRSLFANPILSAREGVNSLLSVQRSLISVLNELITDPVNFACEISLIVRDDYNAYLALRKMLSSSLHSINDKHGEQMHVAIRLICEMYVPDQDEGYEELLCLMEDAQPWQMARIFRSQKLPANIRITKKLADDIISLNIHPSKLSDLQKTNLLALSYTVLSNEKYRLLCSTLLSYGEMGKNPVKGWKRTWSESSKSALILKKLPNGFRERKLKIAVCVSGQLRGFKRAKLTWDRLGLEGHDTDYYVHTWKNIGVRFPDPTWRPHVERRFQDKKFVDTYINICEKYGVSKLADMYPRLFSTDGDDFIATMESLKQIYGWDSTIVIDDEQESKFSLFKNPDKMYYKMMESFRLAQESGKDYDLFIRIRPDLKFNEGTKVDWHDVYEKCALDNVVYTETPPQLKENIFVGDQFAVTTFEIGKIYSESYNFHLLAKEERIAGVPGVRTGHHTLAWNLMVNGIKTDQLTNVKWGGLSDLQKLDNKAIRSLIDNNHVSESESFIHSTLLNSLA